MSSASDGAPISAGEAQFLGWVGAAAVNAVTILTLTMPSGGFSVRLKHHLYDAGQLLAFGLLVWLAVAGWERFGLKRRFAGLAATAITTMGVGLFVLPPTLRGLAEQIGFAFGYPPEAEPEPQLTLISLFFALSVPAAALVAGWLMQFATKRPKIRWALLAFSLAALVVNERLLSGEYEGVHFYISWSAVTIAGAALCGLTLPRRLRWRDWPIKLQRGVLLAACVASAAAVIIKPSSKVVVELFRLDGAVLASPLAQLRSALRRVGGGKAVDIGDGEWVASRGGVELPEHPIFILLTIDAVRADTFASKKHRKKFPNLKKLQSESVDFTEARSTASGTRYAMAGLFGGRYISQLPWANPESFRPIIKHDPSHRFTDVLVEAGVQTMTVVSEWRALVNASGIVRSFQEQTVLKPENATRYNLTPSKDVFDIAIPRLIAQAPDKSLFFFSHLLDPHRPYDLTDTKGSAQNRWRAEIAYTDEQIGRLRKALEDAGQWDRVVLIISSDHGEGFGQHDCKFHNCNLYEELIRVPMFIRVPGVKPRTVDAKVSLIDLGPTVLDLFGLPTPPEFVGESLVPYLMGENPVHKRPIAAEGRGMIAMVTEDNMKVIIDTRRSREEIYDLNNDPRETTNLRDELGERGDELIDGLQDYFHGLAPDLH